MIFTTLGTQKFQMNRLARKVDDIAVKFKDEEFFIQLGNSDYIPEHSGYERFLKRDEFDEKVNASRLIISHSGVGSIMSGVMAGKKVIVVPRLAQYGEHVDDHQIDIAEAFSTKSHVIYCKDLDKLEEIIKTAEKYELKPYKSPQNNLEDMIITHFERWAGGYK